VDIKEELNRFLADSSTEEQEAIKLFVKSLKLKREKPNMTHIASLLQLKTTIIEENILEMEMPNSPLLDNSIGIVHGGLSATLLDTAMGTMASLVPGNKEEL
jgi:acyl-coenzyme A thioesterase PaaI-like protein